jgi:hypothetical protein
LIGDNGQGEPSGAPVTPSSSGGGQGSPTQLFCAASNWFPGQQLTRVGQTIDGSPITAVANDGSGNLFVTAGPTIYSLNPFTPYASLALQTSGGN